MPANETERNAALDRYAVLDTVPETIYDDVTRLAAQICGTPVALLNLIDGDRLWVKSRVGLDICEIPRRVSFCAHTICTSGLFLVPDAAADPRFAEFPSVTGAPHIRFYAGMPLVTHDGYALGSLCVSDFVPRSLTEAQQEALEALARLVMAQLEARLSEQTTLRLQAESSSSERLRQESEMAVQRMLTQRGHILAALPTVLIAVDGAGIITDWNAAAERVFGVMNSEMIGRPFEQCSLGWDGTRISSALEDCCRTGNAVPLEDVEYCRPDGAVRLLGLNFSPLPRLANRSEGFLILAADITERRQSEEALLRSVSRLEAQQEATDDGIIFVDENYKITSFNRNFVRLWKIPDALVGSTLDQPILDYAVGQVANPAQFLEKVEYLYAHPRMTSTDEISLKDGRIFDRYSGPVVSEAGDYYGRVWSFRDITERRRNEERLVQSVVQIAAQAAEREQLGRQIERLSLVSTKTTNAVIITDAEGRIEWVNDSFVRISGYTLAEVLGRKPGHVLQGPGTAASTVAELREAIKHGLAFDGEIYNYHKDGRGYWQTLSINPILSETSQTLQGFIAIQTDIWTDRKRTEEGTAQLAAIVESSHDAIISKNLDDTITSWNSGAEALYGYSAEEMLGQSISLLVPPDCMAELPMISEKFRRGQKLDSYETVRINKDGKSIEVSITVSPIKDAEGRVIGASNISRDITVQKRTAREREEAQKELQQRNWELAEARDAALAAVRLKSEFLANMSHEIRTPMNGVLGMLGLLLDTPLDEEQRFFARTVNQSAASLMTIINDILDFSKAEAGHMAIEHIELSLRDTLEEIADLMAPRAHEKGLELLCDLLPLGHISAEDMLLGDPGRLRQVVTNLIGNAVKFTDTGEVVLMARPLWDNGMQSCWRLSVTDTGIGIPADRQTMIFESFTQADGSTTRRFGGTGLGLTISRQLTALMGGKIGVESTPGQGSTFWVELTFEKAAGGGSAVKKLESTPRFAGRRILLASGSPSTRALLGTWLRAWNWEVLESFDLAEVSQIDVIVIDMDYEDELPVILQRFLQSAPSALPILRLSKTGTGEPHQVCLRKPVSQASLLEALNSFDKPHQGAQTALTPPPMQPRPTVMPNRTAVGRILLAEDNPINTMVAQRLLARLGFAADAITTVTTGQQALQALNVSDFDLVLMDVQMPEMDGLEAVRMLRTQKNHQRLPVIAMTAHAMAGDRERCLEAGMSDYVSKPISAEKLAEVIDRWMPQLETGQNTECNENTKMTLLLTPLKPAFSRLALASISGSDPEIESDLTREFLRSAPGMIARCRFSLEAGDSAGLEHWAHTLKGSGLVFGAEGLTAHCQTLENVCRGGTLDGAVPVILALEEEWLSVQKQVSALLERNVQDEHINCRG